MKINIKEVLKELIADRYLFILIIIMMILAIISSVILGFSIHPSELQLVSHYSAFGSTHLHRDQWFYLLVFVAFQLIVAILHTTITVKLFVVKGHSIAVMTAWFGIGIILLGWVTAFSVLNVWTPL